MAARTDVSKVLIRPRSASTNEGDIKNVILTKLRGIIKDDDLIVRRLSGRFQGQFLVESRRSCMLHRLKVKNWEVQSADEVPVHMFVSISYHSDSLPHGRNLNGEKLQTLCKDIGRASESDVIVKVNDTVKTFYVKKNASSDTVDVEDKTVHVEFESIGDFNCSGICTDIYKVLQLKDDDFRLIMTADGKTTVL